MNRYAPDNPQSQQKSAAEGAEANPSPADATPSPAEANPSPAEAWADFLRTRAPGPFRIVEEPEVRLLIKRGDAVSKP